MKRSGLSSAGRRALRLAVLALVVWLGATAPAVAQDESSTSYEFWPEIDMWLRLSPAWRLSLFVPLSQNIETAYREGNLILQADYGWGQTKKVIKTRLLDEDRSRQMKIFLARLGGLTARSLGDQGETYEEEMLFAELHMRNPLRGRILVSHRLRSDLRWIGAEHDFSVRVRYRLMVEKEFPAGRTSIVPYVNVEPYYDSRYQSVNRYRLIGGGSVAWSPRFAIEGNFTYQHDSKSSVTNLCALNVILHVFF
jgi:hypothetical protein